MAARFMGIRPLPPEVNPCDNFAHLRRSGAAQVPHPT
ncbi:hypothetical protein MTBLM5_90010 [Magnetospirillum sp. LM-5]|nr:hypothetical protein MTBLM5_90010 [Magnetospirillum sp. LM-5]